MSHRRFSRDIILSSFVRHKKFLSLRDDRRGSRIEAAALPRAWWVVVSLHRPILGRSGHFPVGGRSVLPSYSEQKVSHLLCSFSWLRCNFFMASEVAGGVPSAIVLNFFLEVFFLFFSENFFSGGEKGVRPSFLCLLFFFFGGWKMIGPNLFLVIGSTAGVSLCILIGWNCDHAQTTRHKNMRHSETKESVSECMLISQYTY